MPSAQTAIELQAPTLDSLVASSVDQACQIASRTDIPRLVVSPYRFNPLGAHIDHQGGSVLSRTLDQYTLLCFWPRPDATSCVSANMDGLSWQSVQFGMNQLEHQYGWDSMARASVAAFAANHPMSHGIHAVIFGTLVSGGLSSSASCILAYLSALAEVNNVALNAVQMVELVRCVENDYRGLNNGIQDQMSIVFAEEHHLSILDVNSVTARSIADPVTSEQVSFLMCYSGVSRNLVTGSNFNERVAQCREAARLLHPSAQHLGEVPVLQRTDANLATLPDTLERRARHVFGEMQRVEQGVAAWEQGNWQAFGELMNQSCASSINDYESGSEWLIALQEIAGCCVGVYGSRFSGGGFGGCLFMLVDSARVKQVASELLDNYKDRYPELAALARVSIAKSESTVRVITP